MKKNKIMLFTSFFTLMIAIVLACKTPVYKYALQNWMERDYYQILRVYDSTKNQVDVDPEVKAAFEGKIQFTNVGVIPLDISQDLNQMYGEDFKDFLKTNMGDNKPPFHIIMNPRKTVIHAGDFKASDVPSLIMSPKRIELAEKLSVESLMMIFIESNNAEKNKKAVEEIKKGILKAVEIDLDIRSQGDEETPPVDRKTLKPIKMDFVTINAKDEKEKWFYKQMIKINPKIKDDSEPVIFGVVGRGFVFEQPLMGEYLTEEQIVSLMLFLSGPCSCTVKAENGGVDILTSWDWDKTIKIKTDDAAPETKVAGFGGEEVESAITNKTEKAIEGTKVDASNVTKVEEKKLPIEEAKKSENKNQTKLDQDIPVNESDFLKIVLFALIGAAALLFIVTKVMKEKKE
jgi:hypothetical protein